MNFGLCFIDLLQAANFLLYGVYLRWACMRQRTSFPLSMWIGVSLWDLSSSRRPDHMICMCIGGLGYYWYDSYNPQKSFFLMELLLIPTWWWFTWLSYWWWAWVVVMSFVENLYCSVDHVSVSNMGGGVYILLHALERYIQSVFWRSSN